MVWWYLTGLWREDDLSFTPLCWPMRLVAWIVGVFLAIGLLWMVFAGNALAADLTLSVTLSDTQQTALAYATEQENARRVGQKDCTPAVAPATEPTCVDKVPLTQAQMLAQIVGADLTNVLRNMDATVTAEVVKLKKLDARTQTTVLATEPSVAMKARMQQLLGAK